MAADAGLYLCGDWGTVVSSENWHEERDRLVLLLKAIESGTVTHIDEDDMRELQATNPDNIATLKKRLEKLNARLGGSFPVKGPR